LAIIITDLSLDFYVFIIICETKIFLIFILSDASLDGIFKQLDKKEGSTNTKGALFACYRHSHVPVLHVRKAT
jgi:hypothetical protein